jgi:hypothetical protein
VAAIPPDEPRGQYEVPAVLNERRVRFQPVLTLPDLDEIYDQLGDPHNPTPMDKFCRHSVATSATCSRSQHGR